MYTLKRKNHCDYIEYYSWTIRPEDVEEFNKYFNEHYETKGITATVHDFVNTYKRVEDGKLEMEFVNVHYRRQTESLRSILADYINELIENHCAKAEREYLGMDEWEDAVEEDYDLSADDITFLNNVKPREGEPAYSDVWSQIYDYINDKYGDLNYEERSSKVSSCIDYYQQHKK